MSFNPNINKQAQEVIFSKKLKKVCHHTSRFSNIKYSHASSQKHLILTLDNGLTFGKCLKNVSNKVSKSIGLLRKLHNTVCNFQIHEKSPGTE